MVTDRSRGQLLLVGAVVIATVVLASVVLLNTVHSSPSISAEADTESLENVERASGEIKANLGQLFLTTAATATADDRLPYVNTSAFETVVDVYETEYNGIVASDRAFVVDVDYRANESRPGAVAYNRSVFPDGAIDTSVNGTVLGSAPGGSISVGTGPLFPVVSLTATGVDLGSPRGVSLVFDNTSQTDRLNVTDGVSFDDTDPNNGFDCGFGTIDDATVSVEFSAGTGTVTVTEPRNDSSSPRTCAVRDVGFADSYDEVRLEVDGNSVETLSYVLSAAGTDATCNGAGQATCVDGDDIAGNIDVNPSFDISFVDPSVTHESSFTLYEAEDG